ncbi:hypothetical protein N8J89_40095 [Crossiella sp. CA-258035]|uniref:hypothetical protein n=1 Tax=Crossiella sp. CA-258035 TaxID=2981138 RepID=UPI0024BC0886|nr:hypothetical protein [Crossiella sp. CA-258035]WHT19223.1 hypothetical protein N8J89_40095 [Crossiella sp. CA-258035]
MDERRKHEAAAGQDVPRLFAAVWPPEGAAEAADPEDTALWGRAFAEHASAQDCSWAHEANGRPGQCAG